jgi:HK97 family phage major capsid protein
MSADQNELNELQNITHQYRKSLAAYEARTGLAPQSVDARGNGEDKQLFARMDADLSAIENTVQLRAQLKTAEERLARLEAQPVLDNRSTFGARKNPADGPEYAQRFVQALTSRNPQEFRAVTALATDSTGAAIPTDMERRIVELMYQTNVMRSISVVNTIDSKRTIAVESGLPTTTKVAESAADPGTGTAATLSYPTFGTQISVSPIKYVTPVKMSIEFIADAIGANGIGSALDYVARKCAMSMSLKHEEQFTIGDGTGDPQGIATSVITQVTDLGGAAVTTISADNVIDTVHLVAPQYRVSPRFRILLSDTALKTIRKIKDSAGYYIFSPAGAVPQTNVVGLPGTIYGVPYSVGQYVPTGTTNGNVFFVAGDFNYFEIFDRTGIESMLDPYSGALTGQQTLYVYSRTDSRCMNAAAFAAITC